MAVPILTVSQMRQWEQAAWSAGQTEAAVIARVGALVAERVLQLTRPGESILILAGKGHNGDDARQAQPHLASRSVQLLNVPDASAALAAVEAALRKRPALVIDGLFGIGLNRPLDAPWRTLIETVNEAGLPVLSVDTPSGLNAETGRTEGAAIVACITLTLGAPKAGLLASEAQPYAGRIELARDIGLGPCPATSGLWWTETGDFAGFPPRRPAAANKGVFGHLAIVAGSLGYHGAAVLAARGAQRAQPGLITVLPQSDVYTPVASQLQAAMVRPCDPGFSAKPYSALLVGPGLAAADIPEALRARVAELWRELEAPMVADASALDWLPPHASTPSDAIRVITPHPGEAARLLGRRPADVQTDRPRALRELSARHGGCWVVLKGQHTLVGRSEGDLYINSSGNPGLAQGGSGDVLAGYIAGWIAQPALRRDVLTTLRHAVWRHGAAADALASNRLAWTVEELVGELARIP